MRRLITLGLALGLIASLGVASCGPKPAKVDGGVSIKDTIPAAQPEPVAEPAPDVSHAPPGEEDLPDAEPAASEGATEPAKTEEPAPAKAAEDTPPPKEVINYPGTVYGGEIHDPAMTVTEFLKQAESLEGQVVTLEGTLGQVCQDMGCWFYLRPIGATKDNKDKVYVDLQMGAIFTIPKDTEGKHAVVTGTVKKNANGYKLVGKGTVLS